LGEGQPRRNIYREEKHFKLSSENISTSGIAEKGPPKLLSSIKATQAETAKTIYLISLEITESVQ
jgi:hypothetical protein